MNTNKFFCVSSSLIITVLLTLAYFYLGIERVEYDIIKVQTAGGFRDITEQCQNDVEMENLARLAIKEYSRTIRDIEEQGQKDVEMENLARFAIEEYSGTVECIVDFHFHRLVKVKEETVLAGKMYHLTFETKNSVGKIQVYEAKVLVKPWMNVKELHNFEAIKPNV